MKTNKLLNYFKYYLKDNEINLIASFLFPLILYLIIFVNHFSWNNGYSNLGHLSKIQAILSVLWIIPLPIALMSLLGILLYKSGTHLEETNILPFENTVYFRLVTRGINQHTVFITVKNVIETLMIFNVDRHRSIKYVVEIITEKTELPLVDIFEDYFFKDKIKIIELPPSYTTSNNAVYKARALHFAIENSTAEDRDWIFHLDDESQIDRLTILGILEFVSEEEGKIAENHNYKPRIGQGTILYYRNIQRNLLYTLADSIRTADDLGRYFLQYLFGICIFGMHGSFILCRNSIEKKEGFDLLPSYCITEDAYWGLKMMQSGYKFGHVHGFLHEQSPSKGIDFIKQRRRWFLGLIQVVKARDIKLRYRLILILSITLSAFSGLIIIYTALNIIHSVPILPIIGILSSVAFSIYILMYILGFYVNMKYTNSKIYQRFIILIAQLALIPIFAILESSGALYVLLDRKLNFYVIRK